MSIILMGKTGYTCIRHILCGVNLFFWVLGCVILSIGVWLHYSWETYSRILPSYHVLSADNLAIAAGALMILIGFCGCCGSWFQSKCLLITYLSVIVAIMLLEITAGTLGYFFRQTIRETLHQELVDGIKFRYNVNDTNGMQTTWDQVQRSFNCCGVDSYSDWYNITAWPGEDWVPETCCASPEVNETLTTTTTTTTTEASTEPVCGRNPDKDKERYKNHGCFKKIRHFILEHLHVVGLTCIVFAFIQFFSIVGALLIICTMDYRTGRPRSSKPTYNRVPTL